MLPLRTVLGQRSLLHYRSLSSSATHAFDRRVKTLQRDNAARAQTLWRNSDKKDEDVVQYDYLRQELALRLVDRLDDICQGFPLALDLGSGAGYVYQAINAEPSVLGDGEGGIGGVRKLVQLDASHGMLHRDDEKATNDPDKQVHCETYQLHLDEETQPLPFPDGTFDLVISCASLHWVNDLPGTLAQVRRVLKPDGCFLWAMVGGTDTTLAELRASFVLAELEREGGVRPHVGPFVGMTDVGALLQQAGFALPTIDTDTISVTFPNAAVLWEHLQRMGENQARMQQTTTDNNNNTTSRTPLDTFLATACLYDHLFKAPPQSDQSQDQPEIEASVQVIYAIGWAPDASQPQPLKRGSATQSMKQLNVVVNETKKSNSTGKDAS